MMFTESWLKPNTPDDLIVIQNFDSPLRHDRPDCVAGGFATQIKLLTESGTESTI